MLVTLLTAGALGLLFLGLSARVVAGRRSGRVELGDGGNRVLLTRIRAHANFAEYVPLSLLLLFLAEQLYGASLFLIAMAVTLVVARLLHPLGLARPAPNIFRILGTVGTFAVLGLLSGLLLWAGIARL
jgi:uncharacterized membrane protein YecN with MAPEG domain